MSASYVRLKTREWCAEVATSESVPFFDTVNTVVKPPDKLWFSVEFTSEFNEGTFCDSGYIEQGFIKVVVFAHPGSGDVAATDALERITVALMGKLDATRRLVLTRYDGINDYTDGSAGNTYQVAVNIDYQHSL